MGAGNGRLSALVACAALGLGAAAGCDELNPLEIKGWIDPSEMGRFKHEPLTLKIMNQVDPGIEEPNSEFVTATPPIPDDLKVNASDYLVTKNDLLSVEISDLAGPGTQTVKTARVSESGNISLPYVGQIKAEGLTEAELEQTVADTYLQKNILQKAQISITVVEARGRAFTILGAVSRPGQYAVIDPDFRLLDAITLGGDTTSPLLEDVYIIRRTDMSRPTSRPSGAPAAGESSGAAPATRPSGADDLVPRTAIESLRPSVALINPTRPLHMADDVPVTVGPSTGAAPAGDEKGRFMWVDGKRVFIGDAADVTPAASTPGTAAPSGTDATIIAPAVTIETTRPAPATDGMARTAAPGAAMPRNDRSRFEFTELTAPDNVRIIHIPLDRLRNGELQYNVVIKPKDTIMVQNLPIGEYYVGGHVQTPGAYSLTARKITLTQAIIAARMLDQLAVPERTDIVRRLGSGKEVFVRVNLAKIFAGEQADIFLKADDQIRVGTNMLAPFLAAIRGAFRFTYGFGFLYDRNFAVSNQTF